MTYFDVFNGDADGICALHQYRLSNPQSSTLITGVKRDIALLNKIEETTDQIISVFDISFDRNKEAVNRLLNHNAKIDYFDHHFSGNIPSHKNLHARINTAGNTCTSLIVNNYLGGSHPLWAIAGTFGDNLDESALALASKINLSNSDTSLLKKLGILINYNAYGATIEDLHIPPAHLYSKVSNYENPIDFIKSDHTFQQLSDGYDKDFSTSLSLTPEIENEKIAIYILPNEKWVRRISGVFANKLAKQSPQRAHALLSDIGSNSFLVSVRAPYSTKTGADEVCRQFPTGGGRSAAAGINNLPSEKYSNFLEAFQQKFA